MKGHQYYPKCVLCFYALPCPQQFFFVTLLKKYIFNAKLIYSIAQPLLYCLVLTYTVLKNLIVINDCVVVYWSRRGDGSLPSPVYLYSLLLLIFIFLYTVFCTYIYHSSSKISLYSISNSSEKPYLYNSSTTELPFLLISLQPKENNNRIAIVIKNNETFKRISIQRII